MLWVSTNCVSCLRCLSLLALLVGLAACGKPSSSNLPSPIQITVRTHTPLFALPTPPSKTPYPIHKLLQHWQKDAACRPPCWAGITPGQTTVKEAVTILNRHPSITDIKFHSLASDTEEALTWRWIGSESGGGMLGFLEHSATPVVDWMAIHFGQEYSLYQIIDTFGEPTHVVPSYMDTSTAHFGRTIFYDFALIYLSQGFYVEANRTFANPPTVAPGMAWTGRVHFFPRDVMSLAKSERDSALPFTSAELIPWRGFQNFDVYCQLAGPSSDPDELCGRKAH